MDETALELDGYGDGSGSGDGSGDGSGSGYGYGYGYGYGSGYGSGSGSGSGYGYGYGYGGSEKAAAKYFAALLEPHERGPNTVAFWKSNRDGTPANGGSGIRAVVGAVEEVEGPLELCSKRALHGTLNPRKWKGERWWIVELHAPVKSDNDKLGSLKRTILADLGKCPFS